MEVPVDTSQMTLMAAGGAESVVDFFRSTGPAVLVDDEAETLLCAVVRFDGGERHAVRQVVIPFEDAHAADGHAREAGYTDYLVAPLSFAVTAAPPPPRPGTGPVTPARPGAGPLPPRKDGR